jgi:hypothetical protein
MPSPITVWPVAPVGSAPPGPALPPSVPVSGGTKPGRGRRRSWHVQLPRRCRFVAVAGDGEGAAAPDGITLMAALTAVSMTVTVLSLALAT